MYNVRFIEYPTGYQVRVYSEPVGANGLDDLYEGADFVDFVTNESKDSFPVDEWVSVDINFDTLEDGLELRKSESLRISLSRTKNMIYHLARSNVWDFFVTLTVAPSARIDRYDFKNVSVKVRKWFNNLKNNKCSEMYYLIVPERHKDGAWHFHALIGGCNGLSFVDSGKVDKSGNTIYNFENWKFGFSTATKVVDTSKVSGYIAKYVTKTLCQWTSGQQRYWVSKNCQRAEFEDYIVEGANLEEYKKVLYENMSWKKRVDNGYYSVDYFEIPKK